ncbi:hypothetical protein BCU84_01465 [Shewanella sp. 10N.286.51.B7]|uniref:hypothetical protein n=1 Tax=Shewanella sp. 10N.286.51.B7 TaxID=1880836 RepID=UPI000C852DD5|nr:hypothetical protein [Shewanella sp. 10N.286.51.B7]PMG77183.1 hypothetical protein BCU84_01465 [Shewanella sp. 10N.286.51.B7]
MKTLVIGVIVSAALLSACSEPSVVKEGISKQVEQSDTAIKQEHHCNEQFFNQIEQELLTGDGQGHGPDIGSEEWKSVIEFKLGVRGQIEVPERDTIEWCDYIHSQMALW